MNSRHHSPQSGKTPSKPSSPLLSRPLDNKVKEKEEYDSEESRDDHITLRETVMPSGKSTLTHPLTLRSYRTLKTIIMMAKPAT